MEHLVHLKGYRASHDEGGILKLGTKDSFGIETLKIDADEAWDGLVISATFVTSVGRTKMVMKSDNTIVVPPEATAADTRMTVNRIVFSGIKTQVQRITTDLPYEIDPHAPIDGDNSTPRTPDEYIQFVEEMKEEVRNANPVPDPTEEDDGKVPTVRGNQYVLETPQGGGGGSFDINTAAPAFTEAETRENIQTGETIPTLFGKIKKFFTDLKTVAFTGKYSDLTGQPQALKNPNALTFKGGATGTYDGSSPVEIAIPQGGGGSNVKYKRSIEVIAEGTIASGLPIYSYTDMGVSIPELLKTWKVFFVEIYSAEANVWDLHAYNSNNKPVIKLPGNNVCYAVRTFEQLVEGVNTVKISGYFSIGGGKYFERYSPDTGLSVQRNIMDNALHDFDGTDHLYIRNYRAETTVEGQWRIVGVIKKEVAK